jgi:hypothetical protein
MRKMIKRIKFTGNLAISVMESIVARMGRGTSHFGNLAALFRLIENPAPSCPVSIALNQIALS